MSAGREGGREGGRVGGWEEEGRRRRKDLFKANGMNEEGEEGRKQEQARCMPTAAGSARWAAVSMLNV